MNKFKIILIAAALVLSSSAVMAQKTGYIDVNTVIQIMPDAARIDSLMEKFQAGFSRQTIRNTRA